MPLALRGGLKGTAYDSVRGLKHEALMASDKGLELLLETLRGHIQKEVPIRAAELFDRIFYAPPVHRAPDKLMQEYTLRGAREFQELS